MYARAAGLTDVGQKRKLNEDALLVDDELGLFVVSDGMGGHAAGEFASATTVKTVAQVVRDNHERLAPVRQGQGNPAEVAAVLREAVEQASSTVYQLAKSDRKRSGMGCTVTAVLYTGSHAVLAHVGDSRLYLSRSGKLNQMSQDHSLAQELVRSGYLAPEAAKNHPHSHILTRSIGSQPAVQVDTLVFEVVPGDRLLLCSDGLSEYLDDPVWLVAQLARPEPEPVAASLVAHANAAGGKDNITAVVVAIDAPEDEAPHSMLLSQTVTGKFDALDSVFLFQNLPLQLRARVLEHCATLFVPGGTVLVAEDSPCSSLYVVTAGVCELQRTGQRVDELGPGDFVGLTTLLNPRAARATLQAVSGVHLLRLDQDQFWALVRENPRLGVGLLERLGRRMSTALDDAIAARDRAGASRLPGERF